MTKKFINLLEDEKSYEDLNLMKIIVTDEMILLKEQAFYSLYILPLVNQPNQIVSKINKELMKLG